MHKSTRKKLFIILTTQRSGSTYLRYWLNSHEDIRCHDELFLPHYDQQDAFIFYLEKSFACANYARKMPDQKAQTSLMLNWRINRFLIKMLSDTPIAYPEHTFNTLNPDRKVDGKCASLWVGFKLMADQILAFPKLPEILRKYDVNLIELKRNPLDIEISRIVASERNSYHSDSAPPPIFIKVNPDEIARSIRKIRKRDDSVRCMFPDSPCIQISYESLFSDNHDYEIKRIIQFLGLDPKRLGPKPTMIKMVSQPIADIITNYDELKDTLKAAGLSDTLD